MTQEKLRKVMVQRQNAKDLLERTKTASTPFANYARKIIVAWLNGHDVPMELTRAAMKTLRAVAL